MTSQTVARCPWPGQDSAYIHYHDTEWGVPVRDSKALYEMLMLEAFQAGLSWITILRKRENFRKAFHNFDPMQIAHFTDEDVTRLLQDSGIIRHRGKIEATIAAAHIWQEIEKEHGFDNYIWSFVNNAPIINHHQKMSDVPAKTEIAETLSKDLKKRGFKFVGPTICYAFMQATGMVNDHLTCCFRHPDAPQNA